MTISIQTPKKPVGEIRRKFPLTPYEEKFYQRLLVATAQTYSVFPKIGMLEILECKIADDKTPIYARTIDFMIYRRSTLEPVCAIELQDCYHMDPEREQIDEIKRYYLHMAGIPCLWFHVENLPKARDVKNAILNAKPVPLMHPSDIPDVSCEITMKPHHCKSL